MFTSQNAVARNESAAMAVPTDARTGLFHRQATNSHRLADKMNRPGYLSRQLRLMN
jgi:hypothetical protein